MYEITIKIEDETMMKINEFCLNDHHAVYCFIIHAIHEQLETQTMYYKIKRFFKKFGIRI